MCFFWLYLKWIGPLSVYFLDFCWILTRHKTFRTCWPIVPTSKLLFLAPITEKTFSHFSLTLREKTLSLWKNHQTHHWTDYFLRIPRTYFFSRHRFLAICRPGLAGPSQTSLESPSVPLSDWSTQNSPLLWLVQRLPLLRAPDWRERKEASWTSRWQTMRQLCPNVVFRTTF